MNMRSVITPTFLRRYLLVVGVSLIIVVLTLFYLSGFRPGPGLTVVRVGTLVLADVPAGAAVYANESLVARSSGGDLRISLMPGSHRIIVDMPGGHPWNDVVTMSAAQETYAYPVSVPKTVPIRALTVEERARIPALLTGHALPTEENPLSLFGGCAQVTVENNRILASGTTTPTCMPPEYLCTAGACDQNIIFSPATEIRSVAVHPSHDHVLIVSYESQIAVIELNPLSPQFFAPIYDTAAAVLPWSENSIVVVHGNRAYELTL